MPDPTRTTLCAGRRRPRASPGLLLLTLLVLAAVTLGCAEGPGTGPEADPSSATDAAAAISEGAPSPTSAATIAEPTTTTTAPDPIETLVAGMDLRSKVGQLLMIGFSGTTPSAQLHSLLEGGGVGGVVLFGRNIEGPEQIARLTSAVEEYATTYGAGIALLVAVDQEGGTVRRVQQGVKQADGARSVARSMTPAEAESTANEVAKGLVALGVNTNFAPVADVGSVGVPLLHSRTYGDDPATVSAYVEAVVRGQESAGLISVAKHFPGHGSTSGDTHTGRVTSPADLDELASRHLIPFAAAVEAGVPMVMMSHVVAGGLGDSLPASASPTVIQGLLRERLGFEGVVITDDIDMDGSAGAVSAALQAIQAGADMVLIGHNVAAQQTALDSLLGAAESGELSASRLDEAVSRVLRLKLRYGLLSVTP